MGTMGEQRSDSSAGENTSTDAREPEHEHAQRLSPTSETTKEFDGVSEGDRIAVRYIPRRSGFEDTVRGRVTSAPPRDSGPDPYIVEFEGDPTYRLRCLGRQTNGPLLPTELAEQKSDGNSEWFTVVSNSVTGVASASSGESGE